MKILIAFILILTFPLSHASTIDEIRVYKSRKRMDLLSFGKVINSYHIMLGRGGSGPKRKRGDNLVPEGHYFIDLKKADSLFYKALHISYPNDEDIARAKKEGVDPGQNIMIHGFPNHPNPFFTLLKHLGIITHTNWTAGCVAVTNTEMDSIFENIEVYTPVTIFH